MRGRVKERVSALRAEELAQPAGFWYVSFAGDKSWLGGAIVKAHGIVTALDRVNELGINPGGEVLAIPVPENQPPPPRMLDHLLDHQSLREAFGEVQKFTTAQETAEANKKPN